MPGAGQRDTLITIERAAVTQAANGEELLDWAELIQEWAAIFWGRGSERRAAAATQGNQTATFVVLAHPGTDGVMLKDRIVLGGQAWNIVGISPGRSEIEITAVRSS